MLKYSKNKGMFFFKKNQTAKGFTLLETMVALFIFSLAMIAISGIMVSFVKTNRSTRDVQKALEDSEQAMNRMAKKIRTSSIVAPAGGGTVTALRILEYSENAPTPQCQAFRFTGSNIRFTNAVDVLDKDECANLNPASLGGYVNMVDNDVTGSFIVTPSTPTTVGKVTIIMKVQQGTNEFPIQSTVSLRDYTEI